MNKKKKLAIVITSLCLVGALAVGMTLAYFTSSDTKENTFTMGKVDVSMEEKMTDPENPEVEIPYKDYDSVIPNQVLSKIPYLTNNEGSSPAYFRAKIVIQNPAGVTTPMTIADINIDETMWNIVPIAGADGSWYCYYNTIVPEKTTVKVFSTVHIPETWGNEASSKEVKVLVTGEAIQADNFTPKSEDGKIIAWQYEDGTNIDVEAK